MTATEKASLRYCLSISEPDRRLAHFDATVRRILAEAVPDPIPPKMDTEPRRGGLEDTTSQIIETTFAQYCNDCGVPADHNPTWAGLDPGAPVRVYSDGSASVLSGRGEWNTLCEALREDDSCWCWQAEGCRCDHDQ